MIDSRLDSPNGTVYIRFYNGLYYIGQTYNIINRYRLYVRETILETWPEPCNTQRYENEKEFIQFALAMGLKLSNKHLRGNNVTSKEKN